MAKHVIYLMESQKIILTETIILCFYVKQYKTLVSQCEWTYDFAENGETGLYCNGFF